MHLSNEHSTTLGYDSGHPLRHFLTACGTFASNVVDRFHEYADARLTEELTLVEQRKRLLGKSKSTGSTPTGPRSLEQWAAQRD